LLKETDANNVKMELDLAWAIKGGQDPVELFKQNPGRFPLWHVKDLTADFKEILPVGVVLLIINAFLRMLRLAG
jgi:sugar phosphate isomerase/epimerase